MWLELKDAGQIFRCDSYRCNNRPAWSLVDDGTVTNHCTACKAKIIRRGPRPPPPSKGKGLTVKWLRDHVAHADPKCLEWPFSKMPTGYGCLGYLGKRHYAHRLMCELAHGPAPTPKHEAAHRCGNGHLSCVNPRHLTWRTKAENRQESTQHGRGARNPNGSNKGRLTPEQVAEIRSLNGKQRKVDVAARFGISWQSVSMIQRGKMYAGLNKVNHWTDEEDDKLRAALADGCSFRQAAARIGRPLQATTMRAYRLGLKSGWQRAAPAA